MQQHVFPQLFRYSELINLQDIKPVNTDDHPLLLHVLRITPEENTTLSQSSLLLPVCSSAGKGRVGKYTAGVFIPIR